MKLDIQLFANPKLVIETDLNTKNFQNGLNRMQSATQKAGSTIKNIVVGLGITKAIGFAMNQISNSIDGAVARVDTLNNFPRVMESLGIASEDAEKSIKKMAKGLEGLPTTLDQGARAVQRFTAYNGDVRKSTDMFLAVNNAILAGGASMELQAGALEQLTQAYTKGKPEAQDWKTIMQAMPAQLKQVANTMGYTSTAIGGDFYEALMKGDITMEDFMDTVIELNEKGGEGFESFRKQAEKGTEGIRTSITNAKTQVVKGVADIIGALNTRFENTQFGSLAGLIQQVGEKAKLAIDQVAQVINGEMSLLDFTLGITNAFNNALTTINANFPKMFNAGVNAIIEFAKGFLDSGAVQTLIVNTASLIATIVTTISERLNDIVEMGLKIVVALADGMSEAIPYLLEKTIVVLDNIIKEVNDPAFLDKVGQAGGQIIFNLVWGIIKSLPKVISALLNLKDTISRELLTLPNKLIKIGANMIVGLIQGFKSKMGEIKEKMVKWGKDMIDGLIKGMTSKIDSVGNTAKKIANKITSFLHFSKPDEGPLRNYETWMPDMVKGLSKTLKDSDDILIKQTKELANKIKENMVFDDVYQDMQQAINLEQGKLQANVETGRVFNTLQNSTPVVINLNADVEMDSQKVGRLITPEISRTVKSGGGV